MKLSNIFKKNKKVVAIANVEKMDKNQLDKVVGGASVGSIPFVGGVLASAKTK